MICNTFKIAYIKAYAEKFAEDIIHCNADNDKEFYDLLKKNLLSLKGEKNEKENFKRKIAERKRSTKGNDRKIS